MSSAVATFHLRVVARRDELRRIRVYVSDSVAPYISPPLVRAITLAVDEAASNVVVHAYEGSSAGPLDVQITVWQTRIDIELIDEGAPLTGSHLPADRTPLRLIAGKRGGLGLPLMRKLMDSVRIERVGNHNRCLLSCRRDKD
jgi:anti-sigma regulatory factor (Ser/Thr protein kinase)